MTTQWAKQNCGWEDSLTQRSTSQKSTEYWEAFDVRRKRPRLVQKSTGVFWLTKWPADATVVLGAISPSPKCSISLHPANHCHHKILLNWYSTVQLVTQLWTDLTEQLRTVVQPTHHSLIFSHPLSKYSNNSALFLPSTSGSIKY